MQKSWYKPILPHAIAVGIFLLVSFLFCQPAFQHKTLSQHDNDQWKAMAHSSNVYKDAHGHFPLWTQSMFSGMPAYQISMDAPGFSPQYLVYNILTLHLPDPANFFFLGCICFYILAMALRVIPWVGVIGALAYAYTTYNPTALVVGHETKIQAIQIMPAFLAGLVLIFEKRYWSGTATLALFTALLTAANHPQISYYAGMIAVFMTVAYVIRWIKAREYRHLITAGLLTLAGAVIGLACNAVVAFTTLDYAKASLRDGSVLATPGGSVTKTGLSQDYALSYSMYKTEAFELLVPKIYGGGGSINAMINPDDSKAIADIQNLPPQVANLFQESLNFYWGGISAYPTGGPAYAGAIICFLALLSFFLLDGKDKWWILTACIFGIFISWGSYFVDFNAVLLKIIPGLNKFRAPSVAICIPNLLLIWLAILTLDKLLKMPAANRTQTWQQYKKGLYLTGGVFAVLFLCYFSFDYTNVLDGRLIQMFGNNPPPQAQEVVRNFIHDLRADRQSIFFNSLIRSFLFVLGAAALAGLWIKGKLKPMIAFWAIGALAVIDILALDTLYMNNDSYRDVEEAETPFAATPADLQVLKDTTYYRVFDLRYGNGRDITNLATTAWFHRSIGGYHPAKLSIYEDLLENQLEKYPDQGQSVVNMLNTKYYLLPAASGRGDSAAVNPDANGPVWFVKAIRTYPTPRTLMDALSNLDTKDTALLFTKDSAGIGKALGDANAMTVDDAQGSKPNINPVTPDDIYLIHNDNDEMIYHSTLSKPRFAVFSEVYYDRGWYAFIDGNEVPIFRTNYVLRGLAVPAGQHTIRFTFHPASYYVGRIIQILASILLLGVLALAAVKEWRREPKTT
jgi:hypothetical protein